jgi:hypothetical protein
MIVNVSQPFFSDSRNKWIVNWAVNTEDDVEDFDTPFNSEGEAWRFYSKLYKDLHN